MAQYVNGSAAVQLGQEEFEQNVAVQQPGRNLTVLPGSRPQHSRHEQNQTALSPIAVTAIKCAVAFAAIVAVVAIARILLISAAFGYASQNAAMLTQLDEARSEASELEVQQSVYGSADRITSLATEVYGMVPIESVEVLELSPAAAGAAGDGAQTE